MQQTYAYAPFGAERSGSGTVTANGLKYTGRELDGSGYYYYRARYYDPLQSRGPRSCLGGCGSPPPWISGQTSRVRGAMIEHVTGWQNARTLRRDDRPQTAAELALEMLHVRGRQLRELWRRRTGRP